MSIHDGFVLRVTRSNPPVFLDIREITRNCKKVLMYRCVDDPLKATFYPKQSFLRHNERRMLQEHGVEYEFVQAIKTIIMELKS